MNVIVTTETLNKTWEKTKKAEKLRPNVKHMTGFESVFLMLGSRTDSHSELKRRSHCGLKWIVCAELLRRCCQHIPAVAASALIHSTHTLRTVRRRGLVYKHWTNWRPNGWNIKWKNVHVCSGKSSLSPSLSAPRFLLKNEMFMKSCWLSRRSRAVLTLSTVRIFCLTCPLFFPSCVVHCTARQRLNMWHHRKKICTLKLETLNWLALWQWGMQNVWVKNSCEIYITDLRLKM